MIRSGEFRLNLIDGVTITQVEMMSNTSDVADVSVIASDVRVLLESVCERAGDQFAINCWFNKTLVGTRSRFNKLSKESGKNDHFKQMNTVKISIITKMRVISE